MGHTRKQDGNGAAGGERRKVIIGRIVKVVRRHRLNVGGQGSRSNPRGLVCVYPHAEIGAICCIGNRAGVVNGEGHLVAEDVHK